MTAIYDARCDGIAFHYDHPPQPAETLHARLARLVDGTTPAIGDPMLCGSCGRGISLTGHSDPSILPMLNDGLFVETSDVTVSQTTNTQVDAGE